MPKSSKFPEREGKCHEANSDSTPDLGISPSTLALCEKPVFVMDNDVSTAVRLTKNYPNAYNDFYGGGPPCIFKTGPDWHARKGPQAQGIEREARPVYRHAIRPTWLSIGKRICHDLDFMNVKWTFINPLAYADNGEAKPFCSLILSIGVKPYSLLYEAAVATANVVKIILTEAGFPAIEVAFVDSVFTRSAAAGPKLLSFNPLLDDVPELRKPFTPTLGLSTAPLKYPHLEGTAALYLCLGKNNDRIAILTCAHVSHPPPVYPNTGMKRGNGSQAREEFVALGNGGYSNAIKAMVSTISDLLRFIDAWNDTLGRLGEPVEGEDIKVTQRRKDYVALVANATEKIEGVNEIHGDILFKVHKK